MKHKHSYLLLHISLLLYSFVAVFSKMAGKERLFSVNFYIYISVSFFLLGIYAVCWQIILRKLPLTVAFANKAITIIWGIVLGSILFSEKITYSMLVGALIIVIGIILVVSDNE
ncbi:MAG: transporter [Bacillales bacterium]|jgi:drug/metabolite transporter (DMT)-like permease|nr:transporter [Bacillales bacterium]